MPRCCDYPGMRRPITLVGNRARACRPRWKSIMMPTTRAPRRCAILHDVNREIENRHTRQTMSRTNHAKGATVRSTRQSSSECAVTVPVRISGAVEARVIFRWVECLTAYVRGNKKKVNTAKLGHCRRLGSNASRRRSGNATNVAKQRSALKTSGNCYPQPLFKRKEVSQSCK